MLARGAGSNIGHPVVDLGDHRADDQGCGSESDAAFIGSRHFERFGCPAEFAGTTERGTAADEIAFLDRARRQTGEFFLFAPGFVLGHKIRAGAAPPQKECTANRDQANSGYAVQHGCKHSPGCLTDRKMSVVGASHTVQAADLRSSDGQNEASPCRQIVTQPKISTM